MAFSLNKAMLIGNLGKDSETRVTPSNLSVTTFSVATTHGFKNKEGSWTNETTWHNIVAWNGLAETASKYLKKGREIALEGRIVYRTYEDKKGTTRNTTEIVLNDFLFLQSSKGKTKEE